MIDQCSQTKSCTVAGTTNYAALALTGLRGQVSGIQQAPENKLLIIDHLITNTFFFREEIARQRNVMRQRKLQEEGKTDQARADLARLALIKKQREEAARKREEQKKGMLHKKDLFIW